MTVRYEIKRSDRKTLSIEVKSDGIVLVRAPRDYPKSKIEAFIKEKETWVIEKIKLQEKRMEKANKIKPLTDAEKKMYREYARTVFEQKVAYYARIMRVTYGRIAIRDQKTRWGSCSSEGNLNFNWRLVLAPAGVLDYVVIHELAHRKEMNHSKAFWNVVEKTMPDYKKYKKWLKENGKSLHRY